MNITALTGRFTSEPEIQYTKSNVPVISFCLAVDRKYQPQGEEKKVDFIDCVAWRNTAEFISKYFSKGSMIAIEGEIQTRNYTDKNGNNRKATEVLVNNVSFCGSKFENNTSNSAPVENDPLPAFGEQVNEAFSDVGDDDLPF